jgi:hypothetical protein
MGQAARFPGFAAFTSANVAERFTKRPAREAARK